VLQVPLPARDVYNIILRTLNFFYRFLRICNKQMLIYNYIIFGQLSVKDCVNYKQCLNSLRTTLVYTNVWIQYGDHIIIKDNISMSNLAGKMNTKLSSSFVRLVSNYIIFTLWQLSNAIIMFLCLW